MAITPRIAACLWFDGRAEEAANLYVAIFPNSRVTAVSRYPEVGREIHGQLAGSVMTVAFELDGMPFTALNGGPLYPFTEAISFQVSCATQEEIDHYWEKLSAGGSPGRCGWLKDRFGLSWQIIPSVLPELTRDAARAGRVMSALLQMDKLDIAALERA